MHRVILILFTFFFLGSLKAGVYLYYEPVVGYGQGNYSQKIGASSAESETQEGVLGLYTGVHIYGILLGAQGLVSRGSFSRNAIAGEQSIDSNIQTTELGAFLGLQFTKIRLWGGYIFEKKTKCVAFGNLAGTGYKVGLSYLFTPSFAINLEGSMYKYTTFLRSGEYGRYKFPYTILETTYEENEGSFVMLSLSFPTKLFSPGVGSSSKSGGDD